MKTYKIISFLLLALITVALLAPIARGQVIPNVLKNGTLFKGGEIYFQSVTGINQIGKPIGLINSSTLGIVTVSGGSTPSLQEVTDVGSSTTNSISTSGNISTSNVIVTSTDIYTPNFYFKPIGQFPGVQYSLGNRFSTNFNFNVWVPLPSSSNSTVAYLERSIRTVVGTGGVTVSSTYNLGSSTGDDYGQGYYLTVSGSGGISSYPTITGVNISVAGNGTATPTLTGYNPYRSYVFTLSQVSTSNPTATVLYNDLGSIVWTRSAVGTYIGTLSGAFTANKTFLTPSYQADLIGYPYITYQFVRSSANVVEISTFFTEEGAGGGVETDGLLNNLQMFEIRVYR